MCMSGFEAPKNPSETAPRTESNHTHAGSEAGKNQNLEAQNQHLAAYSSHLKELHQVLTRKYPTLQDLFREIVITGARVFDMPLGILSRIEDETYTVKEVFDEQHRVVSGDQFPLGNTYCSEVAGSGNTLAYAHVGGMPEMKNHPVYQNMKLESYIGTPVFANNELYGTLNFSASRIRKEGFNRNEKEYIELMAQAIGKEIEIQRSREELETSNENLKKSSQELDRFAYIVSHDLKAPLRAISNLSEWIEEDLGEDLDEDVKENLKLLKGRVQRLSGLVDGILKYSRVGRKDAEVREVAVRELVLNAIDLLAIPETVSIQLPADLPVLVTPHIRLLQVFQNLISNAFNYNDNPSPEIEILYEPKGDFCRFGVKDNGPGIAPEHHERIFEIFHTLTSKDQRESTGVGLSIVKKSVEEMDGKVWVESEKGKGCTFYFTWPVTLQDV